MTAVGPSTTPNSGGQSSIQILLDAEKEASNRVQEARQYRVQRLKDARMEAESEIEALKESKRKEYSNFEQSISAGLDGLIKDQNIRTENELDQVLRSASQNKEGVIKLLIDKVLDVHAELHPNALLKE